MDVCTAQDVHEVSTALNHLSYCFTPKHHGAGGPSDARWLPDLPRLDEFAVFDMADHHQLSDEDGNLYGLWISDGAGVRKLLELGTRLEQVARFWAEPRPDAHWHGHPLWPITRTRRATGPSKFAVPPPRCSIGWLNWPC